MKKGLVTALFVGAIAFSGIGAYAAAPVIGNLPDVTVGDLDAPNCVGSGQNVFVFTNAFRFDTYVTDADTPVGNLLWSFDEGDDPVAPTTQWYQINGINPVLLGDALIAADELANFPAHVNPGASQLNAVSPWASFEDISFDPEHSTGKTVRFYASDGTNVDFKDTMVNSVDNVCDSLSGAPQLGCLYEDQLLTSAGWEQFEKTPSAGDASYASLSSLDYDAANTALRGRVSSDPGTAGTASAPVNGSVGLFRSAGWKTTDAYAALTLPYAALGSSNNVRSKWYVYATGNSPAQVNTIPATRMQLQNRFVMLTTLEIFTHVNDGTAVTAGDQLGKDIAPSTNPAQPSLYRSDYDPIDAPFLVANGNTEGIGRTFIAQGDKPQDNGYIALTEIVTACYPKTLVDGTLIQTLQPSASDAGGLKITGVTPVGGAGGPFQQRFSYPFNANALSGRISVVDFGSGPNLTEGTFGVTLDSTAYDNLPNATYPGGSRAGILLVGFYPGDNLAARPRVEEGMQYRVRFTVSGTQQSNQQSQLRLQVNTGSSTYVQKYEVGGSQSGGASARLLASQVLPGVGSSNPSGVYDVLMYTPLSLAIRPGAASIAAGFPNWDLFAGPGVNDAAATAYNPGLNRKDLRPQVALLDTLTFTPDATALTEKGNFTITKVEVFEAPVIDDGSQQ
jgi:hypothetical protein